LLALLGAHHILHISRIRAKRKYEYVNVLIADRKWYVTVLTADKN